MKTLPKEKTKNGCLYNLVERKDKVALYEQRYCFLGKIIGYEVFVVKIRQAAAFQGIQFDTTEVFPGDEQFGVTAWAFNSKQWAVRKFAELCSSTGGMQCQISAQN